MSSIIEHAPAPCTLPFPSTRCTPKHASWPYVPSDFKRLDESSDLSFYRTPRFVTHIDDPAISRLTQYYVTVLPTRGKILDFCSSWVSFYPEGVKDAITKGDLEAYGVGMNEKEMAANEVLKGRFTVTDLNVEPWDVRGAFEASQGTGEKNKGELKFDAATCAVSIDYLTNAWAVCSKLLDAMNEGGKVHLIISNRCFPTKVVKRWMELGERGRLELVGDYLHFSSWSNIHIMDLCARDESGKRITDDDGKVIVDSPYLPSYLDPLWVVCGTKT